MKRQCMAALCAMGLALAATPALGVEFKPYGSLEFTWQWDGNIDPVNPFQDSADTAYNFGKPSHQKHFRPKQRLIMGSAIRISENLSATVDVVAGFNTWGGPASGVMPYPQMNGGALGTRSGNIVTRTAYLDWFVPNTKIRLRMGQQFFNVPGFATGSLPIKPEWGTGIIVDAPITDNLTANFLWVRAASGPRRGTQEAAFPSYKYSDDTVDAMVLRPLYKGEGYRFAPYIGMAVVGKDSFTTKIVYNSPTQATLVGQGYPHFSGLSDRTFMPVYAAAVQANLRNGTRYTPGNLYPFWLGLGGEITKWDPFRFAFDLAYGGTKTEDGHKMFRRGGWYAGIEASYKVKYGTPTLKAWYASGDDSNIQNGSERATNWGLGNANAGLLNASALNNITLGLEGGQLIGTWGFSLQWNNLSLIRDLRQSFRMTYYQGTNSPAMASYVRQGLTGGFATLSYGTPVFGRANPGSLPLLWYMTRKDRLLELDFESVYNIYKNLTAMFEVNYIFTDFDGKVWGAEIDGKFREAKTSNSWRAAVSLCYRF